MWTTTYYTPTGEVELPDAPEGARSGEVLNNAHEFPPSWLVFPEAIINTSHVIIISFDEQDSQIFITTVKEKYRIVVKDVNKTWHALQHVFGGEHK